MPTYSQKETVCALCGKKSMQLELNSYSVFSSADLDFRPSDMLRGTMEAWIEQCPHCLYASKDISKSPHIKTDILKDIYEKAAFSENMNNLALCFEKYALYLEYKKDLTGAIQNHLGAAWVCDDDGDDMEAIILRTRCLQDVEKMLQKFLTKKKRRKYMLIKADLLRRVRRLKELKEINTEQDYLDFASKEILIYQKLLAEKNDFSAHSQDEIDLNPYDDFFEKKENTEDITLKIKECIKDILSLDQAQRDKALNKLDLLRPQESNIPYYEIDGILSLHQGKPICEDYPLVVKYLAPKINDEALEFLESYVISPDTLKENVTEKNIIAMTLLHELYKSPYIADEFKDHAQKQKERLYFMHIDPDDEEATDYYLTLIYPLKK